MPAVSAARFRRDAAEKDISVARWDQVPDPSIGVRYGDDGGTDLFGISISIPIPVLNTGQSEVAAARADAVSEWVSASNRFELQRQMEAKLSIHPGLPFSFSQPIATRVDELLSGVKAQLAVKLFGPDLTVLAEQGKAIKTSLPGKG